MQRRPRSPTRTDTLFPTRRSSDRLGVSAGRDDSPYLGKDIGHREDADLLARQQLGEDDKDSEGEELVGQSARDRPADRAAGLAPKPSVELRRGRACLAPARSPSRVHSAPAAPGGARESGGEGKGGCS